MNCSGFRARHLEFVDDTLEARTRAACEAHRDACAACARLDARVRRSLLLCHNVRLATPSCDLSARVLAAVRTDRRQRDRRVAMRRAVGGWAALAAACAGIVFGVTTWQSATTPATSVAGGAAVAPALEVPASVVVSAPTPVAARPLPVLGPLDEPPAILGDTFPPAPMGRPTLTRRTVEPVFMPVGFPAP